MAFWYCGAVSPSINCCFRVTDTPTRCLTSVGQIKPNSSLSWWAPPIFLSFQKEAARSPSRYLQWNVTDNRGCPNLLSVYLTYFNRLWECLLLSRHGFVTILQKMAPGPLYPCSLRRCWYLAFDGAKRGRIQRKSHYNPKNSCVAVSFSLSGYWIVIIGVINPSICVSAFGLLVTNIVALAEPHSEAPPTALDRFSLNSSRQ